MTCYSKMTVAMLSTMFLAAGTTAYAYPGDRGEAAAISSAKISLAQAVTIAEQHIKGKAVNAEYDHSMRGWVYEVEVLSNGKEFDVKIDPSKGTVLSVVEDRVDDND